MTAAFAVTLCGVLLFGIHTGDALQSPDLTTNPSGRDPAEVPRLIPFSGITRDSSGKPITTPTQLTFAFYREEQGGPQIWIEIQRVQPDASGHFSVLLGAVSADGIPLDAFSTTEARWIGITPDGGVEAPRVMLISVPYALKAADAETLDGLPASAFLRSFGSGIQTTPPPSKLGNNTYGPSPGAGVKTPPLTGSGTVGYLPVWISPTQLIDSTIAQSGSDIEVGTSTLLKAATGIATTFDCEAYSSLNACLDAAKAYAGTSETGTGHAAKVILGDGVYPLSAPYVLTSGITITGVKPRLQSKCANADSCMVFNGGTIIDCGGKPCFTSTAGGANGVSDINLQSLGFQNWSGAIWTAGGNSNGGCNFCTLRDIVAIGLPAMNGSDQGFVFFNSQHITADNIKIANVNTGWAMFAEGATSSIPGNSEIDGLYIFTYPKSTSSGNSSEPGILLQTIPSSAIDHLNLISLKRPQVNTYGQGDMTSDGIQLNGVNNISIWGADVEVNAANAIHLIASNDCFVDVAEILGSGSTIYGVNVDSSSSHNVVNSENPFTLVYLDPAVAKQNVFYGVYSGTAFAGAVGQGVYNISGQGATFNGISQTALSAPAIITSSNAGTLDGLTIDNTAGTGSSAIDFEDVYAGVTYSGSIASSWYGSGMTFTLPRNSVGKGFFFNNNSGKTLMYIDSANGKITTTNNTLDDSTGNMNIPAGKSYQVNGTSIVPLDATTGSIGGSALAAGTCASASITVPGATASMVAVASPVTSPGPAFQWNAYVSGANLVTVAVCTNLSGGGTPAASAYNVRVIR